MIYTVTVDPSLDHQRVDDFAEGTIDHAVSEQRLPGVKASMYRSCLPILTMRMLRLALWADLPDERAKRV